MSMPHQLMGLISEEESNDEELTEDGNDLGDEAPGAGSRDEPMDVDTIYQQVADPMFCRCLIVCVVIDEQAFQMFITC